MSTKLEARNNSASMAQLIFGDLRAHRNGINEVLIIFPYLVVWFRRSINLEFHSTLIIENVKFNVMADFKMLFLSGRPNFISYQQLPMF